jgi:hypothetical protein
VLIRGGSQRESEIIPFEPDPGNTGVGRVHMSCLNNINLSISTSSSEQYPNMSFNRWDFQLSKGPSPFITIITFLFKEGLIWPK